MPSLERALCSLCPGRHGLAGGLPGKPGRAAAAACRHSSSSSSSCHPTTAVCAAGGPGRDGRAGAGAGRRHVAAALHGAGAAHGTRGAGAWSWLWVKVRGGSLQEVVGPSGGSVALGGARVLCQVSLASVSTCPRRTEHSAVPFEPVPPRGGTTAQALPECSPSELVAAAGALARMGLSREDLQGVRATTAGGVPSAAEVCCRCSCRSWGMPPAAATLTQWLCGLAAPDLPTQPPPLPTQSPPPPPSLPFPFPCPFPFPGVACGAKRAAPSPARPHRVSAGRPGHEHCLAASGALCGVGGSVCGLLLPGAPLARCLRHQ